MAGLGVLLETKEKISKYTHIISKTSLKHSPPSSSTATSSAFAYASSFLEYCNLCRRKLQQGNDIYMYRGDRAFCSEECRCRQIFMDEESLVKDHCSLVAATTAAERKHPAEHRRGRAAVRGQALAGDVAF